MRSISVVIPSLNDGKLLKKCLESICEQIYEQKLIEILVIDGGSSDNTKEICKKFKANYILEKSGSPEKAKGIGIEKALNEIILMLDCDNLLPTKNWLKEMISVFEKEQDIVGVYTWKYCHRKKDKILNRYFALFGVNDPVAWFLGKADRQSYLNDEYNLLGKAIEQKKYFLVEFEKDKIPTLGANGFLIRKEILNKAKIENNCFFHIDVNVDLIEQSFNKYGVVKNCIIHSSGESILKFFYRRRRYMEELYFRDFGERRYFLYDPKKDLFKIILYCLYSLSIFLPLITSVKGFLKKKDLAWFLHPIMCLGMVWIYGLVVIKRIINFDYFINKNRYLELKKYYLNNFSKVKILDVGSGNGLFINVLLENNYEVTGVDLGNYKSKYIYKSRFEDFKSKYKYKIITMFHFVEHTEDPSFVFKKANTMLEKDGLLVVETPLIGNLTEYFLQKNYLAYFDKTHINLFTDKKLKNMLLESGFKIEKIGFTLFQFPLTLITSSFRKGIFYGILGILLFVPLKVLQIVGLNKEIVRYYCRKIS